MLVEEHVLNPDQRTVCIREVQRSLKYSAKQLIEDKIAKLGVGHLFDVTRDEIRSVNGSGIIIFQGMMDHTADSIKSLENFSRAWVEEAQSLSARSMELLLPTIRTPGSEIWFTWNPDQPSDPVDRFLVEDPPPGSVVVHVNYTDNPWCPAESRDLAKLMRRRDPEAYGHIWLGEYNKRSDAIVLAGKVRVDDFEVPFGAHGPYYGADWGFAQDPTTLIRCWVKDARLYIDHEAYGVGVEIVDTPALFASVPGARDHLIRADSARPETISHVRNQGWRIESVDKWPDSVKDGIAFLRSFDEIVIHERCTHTIQEARLYSYKVDRLSGDVLPVLVDKHNHTIDALRYALAPLIRRDFPMAIKLGVAM
jgi:phage terminase large subunit